MSKFPIFGPIFGYFFLKIRGEKCLPNSEEVDEEVLGTVHRGGKAGHSHCLQGKGIGDDTSG